MSDSSCAYPPAHPSMLTHPRGIYWIVWQLRDAVVESSWHGDSALEELTEQDWRLRLCLAPTAPCLPTSCFQFCCDVPRAYCWNTILFYWWKFSGSAVWWVVLWGLPIEYMWKFFAPYPQMVDLENWSLFVAILPVTFNAYGMPLCSWISLERVAAIAYSH